MELSRILADIDTAAEQIRGDIDIADIVYDSRRKDVAGCLFVCLVGARLDGHDYAADVYARGCRAFLVQRRLTLPEDAVQIVVPDTREAMALASAAYFGYPARSLAVIGITGTKGKTTVAELTRAVLAAGGINTAYIGTTGILIGGERTPTKNTTPESYELHRAFRRMADAGVSAVVMEVSSQAVYMKRIAGIHFHIGVFTNLSRDHIGGVEHPTFEHYMMCKSMLFRQCRYGILNADDIHYTDMIRRATSLNSTFGMEEGVPHDVGAKPLGGMGDGTVGERFLCRSAMGEVEYTLRMPGRFNIYNALAVIAVAERMRIPPQTIVKALARATVKGRFEPVDAIPGVQMFIDYAHNRTSMEATLRILRACRPRRLMVLFGSIGDRAKERRQEQAEVVSALADYAVITTDNPGHEDPEAIIAEIASHMTGACRFSTVTDRAEAVRLMVSQARPGDIILFAGKGHETYQIVGGEYLHYDEREEIEAAAMSLTGKMPLAPAP